jgi:hypothetical protein
MKLPSKADWWLIVIAIFLLLAGGFLWNISLRRTRYARGNEQFVLQYREKMTALQTETDAVEKRFAHNRAELPEITSRPEPETEAVAVRRPVPVSIRLQGISWQKDRPIAMINEKVYQAGAQIGDCTLEEIKIDAVRLRDSTGTVIEIKLMEDQTP